MTIPIPDFQADVNTRGRTDNTFYDHINAAVMSATGSPTLAGSDSDQHLTFNGSSQYVQTARPASLAAAFADSQFTMAVRFKSTGAIAAFSDMFGFTNSADARRLNILLDNTAGLVSGGFDTPSGTDVFLVSATQGDDTNWHVATMRRDGTDLSLWVDGVEVATDATAPGAMGTLDELCIARRGGTFDGWHFAGSVQWVAVWESALTDAQIQELDDASNPFLPASGTFGTYLRDTFTDTDGVLASAHTISVKRGSQAWAFADAYGGSGGSGSNNTIQSNRLRFAAANHLALVDPGSRDIVMRVKLVIGGTTGVRCNIPVSYTDNNNHIFVNVREPAGQKDCIIYQLLAGVQTALASVGNLTLNLNTTYDLEIIRAGTTCTVKLNGYHLVTTNSCDASLTGTLCGLGTAGSATNVEYDDFEVTNGVTPAVSAASDITLDSTLGLTFTGFVAAPTGVTFNGVTEAFSGSPSSSTGTLAAIPLSDLVPSGAHEASNVYTDYDLVVTDGIDSATVQLSLIPAEPLHYGELISGFSADNTPSGSAIGMDCLIGATVAEATCDPVVALIQPLVSPLDVPVHVWDGDSWLYKLLEYSEEEVTYAFFDTFVDANGTPPAAHTPDRDEYGEGWSAVEKAKSSSPSHSDGVTIEDGELVIQPNRGVSINIGNVSHVARVRWRVAAAGDRLAVLFSRRDQDNHLTAWLRQDGPINAYLIQHHNGADLPNPVVVPYTFEVGSSYLVEAEREDSGLVSLTINGALLATMTPPNALSVFATRVGVYSNDNTIYLPSFAVNAELPPENALTLTASDETPVPGDEITLTVGNGTLANTSYVGTINGVAATLGSKTTGGCTLSIPAIAEFDSAGSMVNTLFNRNVVIELDDGTNVASTTIQVGPPEPSLFGTIGGIIDGEVPAGTAGGDDSYLHLVSGSFDSADPNTMAVDVSEKTSYYAMVADTENVAWRERLLVDLKIAKTMKTSRQEVRRVFAMSGSKKQVINTYVMIDGEKVKLW